MERLRWVARRPTSFLSQLWYVGDPSPLCMCGCRRGLVRLMSTTCLPRVCLISIPRRQHCRTRCVACTYLCGTDSWLHSRDKCIYGLCHHVHASQVSFEKSNILIVTSYHHQCTIQICIAHRGSYSKVLLCFLAHERRYQRYKAFLKDTTYLVSYSLLKHYGYWYYRIESNN